MAPTSERSHPSNRGTNGATSFLPIMEPAEKASAQHSSVEEEDDCGVSRVSTERAFFYPPLTPTYASIAPTDKQPTSHTSDITTTSYALTSPLSSSSFTTPSTPSDAPLTRMISHPYQMGAYYTQRTDSDESLEHVKALPLPPIHGVASALAPTAGKAHNISITPNRTHTGVEFMRSVTDTASLPSPEKGVSSQENRDLEALSSRSKISRIQSLQSYFKTRPLFLLLLFLPIPPLLSMLYLLIGHAVLRETSHSIPNSRQNSSIRPTFLMTTHIGATGGAILIVPLALAVYALYRFRPSSFPSNTLDIDHHPIRPAEPLSPGAIQVPANAIIHTSQSNPPRSPHLVSRFSMFSTVTEHQRYGHGTSKLRIAPGQWAKQRPPLPLPNPEKQPTPQHADDFFEDDQSADNARGGSSWCLSFAFSGHGRGWDLKTIGLGIACLFLVLSVGPLAGALGAKCLERSVLGGGSGDGQGNTLLTAQGAAAAGIVGSTILVSVVALFSGIVMFFRRRRSSSWVEE